MFNAKSREDIDEFLKKDSHLRYVMELSTGAGKTKFSITKMQQWHDQFGGRFLVVIPKLVLIDNWKTEFEKFGFSELLEYVEFTTYNSLQKHTDDNWTAVVFDEVQHLSDRCKTIFKGMTYRCFIGLSATIKRDIRNFLWYNIRGLEWIKMTLKDAIDNEVLPNPKIVLIPLKLDDKMISEVIIKNPKIKDKVIDMPYKSKNLCYGKKAQYRIHCTQKQWYDDINSMIEWLKNRGLENAYLKKCGDRLKWLSDKKTEFVKELLRHITRHRVIVFCSSIAQSKELGMNSINSKDGIAQDILDKFNRKEINKVTSINSVKSSPGIAFSMELDPLLCYGAAQALSWPSPLG